MPNIVYEKVTTRGSIELVKEEGKDYIESIELGNKANDDISATPILSWKDVEVVSTTPHRKFLKIADDLIFGGKNEIDLKGSKILKGVSGQITGGLWGKCLYSFIKFILFVKCNQLFISNYG